MALGQIGSSELLLSILWTEYETPLVRKLGTSGQGDVGDCRQADYVILERALSRAINGILEE